MSEQVQQRIFAALAAHAASAFEGMTGERPEAQAAAAGAPTDAAIRRRQTFSGVPGALWIAASEADAIAGGGLVLRAAGLEETDREKSKSEFHEIVNQVISGLAREMSEWAGHEVRPERAEDYGAAPADISWASIGITQGGLRLKFAAGVEPALSTALAGGRELEKAPQTPPSFDLLLDVELPISVSFGRAEVALKDVLKLTTGSIVELDRGIGDSVEVIVNNCVIARGEVVAVEGNFGVRIQQVVSRQERWNTLH